MDSWPSHDDVGGFFDRNAPRRYELRERDRKRAKKAIKDAREWLKDPTPLWARTTNWRLMLKGPLKEPLALPTKDAASDSASSLKLNLPGSRRWRRCGHQRAHAPRVATPSFRAGE